MQLGGGGSIGKRSVQMLWALLVRPSNKEKIKGRTDGVWRKEGIYNASCETIWPAAHGRSYIAPRWRTTSSSSSTHLVRPLSSHLPQRIWRHARLFAQLNSRVFSILFCTILKPQKIRPWPAAINSTRVPRWSAKMFDTPIINNAVISFVRLQLRFINEKECRPLVSINQKSSVDDLFFKQEEEVENWTF